MTTLQKFILTSVVSLTASTALVAWSFSEPGNQNQNSNAVIVTAPLNTGAIIQRKFSGLGVNFGKADTGLTVGGHVSIGQQNALEQLHLIGNLFITGIIKPDNLASPIPADKVLTIAPSGNSLAWADKYAWLSLTARSVAPNTCNPGAGDNCSNNPLCACGAGLFCWQGVCVIPPPGGGFPPPLGGPNPPGCGDGVLDLMKEQCEPLSPFSCPTVPIETVCDDGTTGTQQAPQECQMCQCVNPYIPPSMTCGGVGPPVPPPSCGQTGTNQTTGGPTCGGTCLSSSDVCRPDDAGGMTCDCLPLPPQPGGTMRIEEQSDLLAKVSGIPGIKVAEAAQCAPSPQPMPCPTTPTVWTEAAPPFGLVCAELNDGSSMWVRNCYQDKLP